MCRLIFLPASKAWWSRPARRTGSASWWTMAPRMPAPPCVMLLLSFAPALRSSTALTAGWPPRAIPASRPPRASGCCFWTATITGRPICWKNCALPYPPRRVTAGTSAAIWSRTKARGWMPSLIPARWSGSPPARMPTPITPPAWRGCMPQATGRSGAFVLTGNFWLSITCFSGMRSAGRRIIPLTWCWPVPAPGCITWMWSWWSTAPTGRAAC